MKRNTFMRLRGLKPEERMWVLGETKQIALDLRTPPVPDQFPVGPCKVFCIVEDKVVKIGYTYRPLYEVVERFDYKTLWILNTVEKYALEIIELAKAAGYRILIEEN